MRDYFLFPAQTNLELYAQALEHAYSPYSLRRLADAYHFAARQVYPLVRGSGKPFIAHLTGAASIVLESGKPEDWVISALLHALYQRRIPFEGGLPPEARRVLLAAKFGSEVDGLVTRYTAMEDNPATGWLEAETEADVLTLHLADELEDLSGHALALHGSPEGDDPAERGGYMWRSNAKAAAAPGMQVAAMRHGLDGIARGLKHWLNFASYPAELKAARTGLTSSTYLHLEKDGR